MFQASGRVRRFILDVDPAFRKLGQTENQQWRVDFTASIFIEFWQIAFAIQERLASTALAIRHDTPCQAPRLDASRR